MVARKTKYMEKTRSKFIITLLGLIFFAVSTNGQNLSVSLPDLQDVKPGEYLRLTQLAQQRFRSKDYVQTVEIVGRLLNANPSDGNNWTLLASSHFELKQYREAIVAYKRSSDLGFLDRALADYQIARCYSFLADKEAALEWLNKALKSRYRYRTRIIRDDAFQSLRDDPRFRQIAGLSKNKITNRIPGWTSDLDYLISEVKRVHYRFSREPLPGEFLRTAAEIRRDLPRLSDSEIVVKLQRLFTLLGDGHSLIYPFGMTLGSLKRLPLTFYLFSDGLFVINAPNELKGLIGKKVLTFGQTPTEEVIKRLEQLVSRDNPMGIKWSGVFYLTLPDYLKELGIVQNNEQVSLVLEETGNKKHQEVIVTARKLNPDEINIKLIPLKIKSSLPDPLYLSRLSENYWFQKLDPETVFFQFNQVQNQQGEALSAFSIRLRKALDDDNIKNLIIDARLNNGGEATLLNELYRTLIHFETTRPNSKIYVLIGRDTFSAAQTFVSTLNYLTSAIYVGEPSGSKPNRVGDEAQFTLPFSGVSGSIASGYNQAANKDSRIWIAPDIPVELSSDDYFNNRDPGLQAVLEIIKTSNS